MNKAASMIKRNWWPISAILFCPCHLPLSMGAIVALTAGTTVGTYITANYTSLESITAVIFSFYFVVAFLIWAIRGPSRKQGMVCALDEHGNVKTEGFSTRQIAFWGVGSALLMPTLVLTGLIVKDDLINQIIAGARGFDLANSGFIWLISISTIVMIPVMVVWIAWMWKTWTKVQDASDSEQWQYEYE